jgi:hypothetical protein
MLSENQLLPHNLLDQLLPRESALPRNHSSRQMSSMLDNWLNTMVVDGEKHLEILAGQVNPGDNSQDQVVSQVRCTGRRTAVFLMTTFQLLKRI